MKKAWFYICPIYFNPCNNEVMGRGRISDVILNFFIIIHCFFIIIASIFISLDWNFPIRITGDKE